MYKWVLMLIQTFSESLTLFLSIVGSVLCPVCGGVRGYEFWY